MLCIIQTTNGQITGWIIATDVHDARRRVQAAFLNNGLAAILYRMEFTPPPGKHDLGGGYTLLVQ